MSTQATSSATTSLATAANTTAVAVTSSAREWDQPANAGATYERDIGGVRVRVAIPATVSSLSLSSVEFVSAPGLALVWIGERGEASISVGRPSVGWKTPAGQPVPADVLAYLLSSANLEVGPKRAVAAGGFNGTAVSFAAKGGSGPVWIVPDVNHGYGSLSPSFQPGETGEFQVYSTPAGAVLVWTSFDVSALPTQREVLNAIAPTLTLT